MSQSIPTQGILILDFDIQAQFQKLKTERTKDTTMQKLKLFAILLCCTVTNSLAQQTDTTITTTPQPTDTTVTSTPQPQQESTLTESKVYYGGTLSFSFGDIFRIGVAPYVGYKVTPKFSVGGKIGYEYLEDNRYSQKLTSHNYGGSVFTRYQIHPRVYAHGEFAYISYSYKISELESDRLWVPFLLLGGGFMQPMGGRSSLIVEVLFDVLQDGNSPYEKWSPFVSIGVGVGI
jgi:hypothetical protein